MVAPPNMFGSCFASGPETIAYLAKKVLDHRFLVFSWRMHPSKDIWQVYLACFPVHGTAAEPDKRDVRLYAGLTDVSNATAWGGEMFIASELMPEEEFEGNADLKEEMQALAELLTGVSERFAELVKAKSEGTSGDPALTITLDFD